MRGFDGIRFKRETSFTRRFAADGTVDSSVISS